MEEDIDIEEHDVLDNPRIRNIFPDITKIKAEIPDDDYDDPDHQMEYQPYSAEGSNLMGDDAEYERYGNKIILGSKPNPKLRVSEDIQNGESVLIFGRKPVQVKEELEEHGETEKNNHGEETNGVKNNQLSTVLILGSKPSKSGVIAPLSVSNVSDEVNNHNDSSIFLGEEVGVDIREIDHQNDKKPRDPSAAVVILEDWGPSLDNSLCYCKECKILFPTSNTLLAHNNTAHSFLIALDKNKAVKSTAKPNVKPGNGKFCNHCNKIFPDSDSLINHLYKKLTFDKNHAGLKNQPKKVVSNPFSKQVNANLVKVQKQSEVVKTGSDINISEGADNLFQCEVCGLYLQRLTSLKKHMTEKHSKRSYSTKSVHFNGICPYCKSSFSSTKYYNKHVPRKHAQLYLLKNPDSASIKTLHKISSFPEDTKLTPNKNPSKSKWNDLFQCKVCNKVLLSYGAARRHKRMVHPTMNTLRIFDRVKKTHIVNKKALNHPRNLIKERIQGSLASTSISQLTESIAKPKNQIVIPQSILFKCNLCETHFTSCTATMLHSKSCGKQKDDWKCNICSRTFQKFDQTVHKRQHQISDKFSVIVFRENIYGRVLNQCPNCKLYFHEKEFYLHDQKSFCKTANKICEKCVLPIHLSSVDSHNYWHERIKTERKHMILVNFTGVSISTDNTPVLPAKRVLDFGEDGSPAKKPKIVQKIWSSRKIVRYCQSCGLFMFNFRSSTDHTSGKCKFIPAEQKRICKTCGLTFKSSSHMNFHRDHPDVTLMDMKFTSLKERRIIAPPIPNFPGCTKCKVHFCRNVTVLTHNCSESYKTCKHCNKRFSDLAYKLHMKFHEYHMKFKAFKTMPATSKPLQRAAPKTSKDPLPELLKKYQMLTNTWQILYTCATCDIVCDNYDKVVDHCQKHFNNMESYDIIIKYCEICDLKFDGSCFDKHMDLHAQNKGINKDSFTILCYKYECLLQKTWLDQFKRLPASQLQQILSRSIYNPGRSVKLRVVQEGPPENTIYRCGRCENFISTFSLTSHYQNESCDKSIKHLCRHCKIPFCTVSARAKHEESHKTAKSFNVVYFNEPGDEEYNKVLRENDPVQNKYTMGSKTIKGDSKMIYQYYRCKKCKCCLSTKLLLNRHNCSDAKNIVRCKLCPLNFVAHVMNKHMKLHALNPRFVKKNIKCTLFENKGARGVVFEDEEEKNTVKLFKCRCGLHFTSTKSIEKHLGECGTDISKEKCSKCKRLFDTTQLVTHLCKHHSNDKNTRFVVLSVVKPDVRKTLPKNTTLNAETIVTKGDSRKNLYKCHKCNVCYLSMGGLEYHFSQNHQVFKVRPCPHCKLNFMPMTLTKHVLLHHGIIKCNVADFNIHVGVMKKGKVTIVKKSLATKPQTKVCSNEKKTVKCNEDVDINRYSNKLYKCNVCHSHFMTYFAMRSHKYRMKWNRKQHGVGLSDCPDCGYAFMETSLPRHRDVHHETMKLKREDFVIEYIFEDTGDNKSADQINKSSKDDTGNDNDVDGNISSVEDKLHESTDDTEKIPRSKTGENKSFEIDNVLYKCTVCKLIFMKLGLGSHLSRGCRLQKDLESYPCCGLNFSPNAFRNHKLLHERNRNISRADLHIIPTGPYNGVSGSNHLFRCVTCLWHFDKVSKLKFHISNNEHNSNKKPQKCKECGLLFPENFIETHVKLHHEDMKLCREDFVVMQFLGATRLEIVDAITVEPVNIVESKINKELTQNNSVTDTNATDSAIAVDLTKDDSAIYKCNGCCKHFLNKSTLRNHLLHASPQTIPNKEICKQCGLHFSRISLQKHIIRHHRNRQSSSVKYFHVIDQIKAGMGNFTCVFINKIVKQVDKPSENIAEDNVVSPYFDNEGDTLKTDVSAPINKIIYRCQKCESCFLTLNDVQSHFTICENIATSVLETEKCNECNLVFHNSLSSHIKLHHGTTNLKLEDLDMINYLLPEKSEKTTVVEKQFESSEKLSTLDKTLYTNLLFKCRTCSLHFLVMDSLDIHVQNPKLKIPKATCMLCGLVFSVNTLATHVYIHHEKMSLKCEDFITTMKNEVKEDDCKKESNDDLLPEPLISAGIFEVSNKGNEVSDDSNMLSESKDIVKYIDEDSKSASINLESVIENRSNVETTVASAFFFNEDTKQFNDGIPTDVTEYESSKADDSKKVENSGKMKLYKCAACNVCFITQIACYRHTTKHVAFDPKDYIECKLCGYQFLIANNSLHKHITKHHQSIFKPEDVLIEEYHPDVLCHGTPKIDIYFGTDKLQSKLISTTSDANSISSLSEEIENDKEAPEASIRLEYLDFDNDIEIDINKNNSVVDINLETSSGMGTVNDSKSNDKEAPEASTRLEYIDFDSDFEIDINKNKDVVDINLETSSSMGTVNDSKSNDKEVPEASTRLEYIDFDSDFEIDINKNKGVGDINMETSSGIGTVNDSKSIKEY